MLSASFSASTSPLSARSKMAWGLFSPSSVTRRGHNSRSRVASTSSQNSRRKALRRCFRRRGDVFILVLILFLQNQKRFHPLIRDESAFFCKKWGRPTKICAAAPSQFNILPFYVIYKNVFSAVPYGTCPCAYAPADSRQPAEHRLHAPEHLPSSWWYRSGSACRSPGGHPVPAGSRGSPGRAWS